METNHADHTSTLIAPLPVRKSRAGRKPIGEHAMDAVLHVRITRVEQDALKILAVERGVSIGGLLRTVITDLLAKK